MKKALLAVAVLAASSSAFAATATDKHKVVIIVRYLARLV